MKVFYLLVIAICLSSISYCQTWKNTGVENSGNYIFFNADDVSKINVGNHMGVLKTWLKQKFNKHKLGGVTYSNGYSLTLYFFDCHKKLWSINELIYYDSTGKVIKDFSFDLSWKETPPGTQIALVLYSICLWNN